MLDWKQEIRTQLEGLDLSLRREAEIVEELSQHLEDRYLELRASGLSNVDARQIVLDEIKESDLFARELRRVETPSPREVPVMGTRRINLMTDFLQDLQYGFRTLRKTPGFTAVAVFTLALGIGANTAIFSVVNGILLKPLPYRQPDRLVWLWNGEMQTDESANSPANFLDYQSQNRSFEQMAAFRNLAFTLTNADQPERVLASVVSANYLLVLGVEPILGRNFSLDDGKSGAQRVAILSNEFWRSQFNADQNIVGKTMVLTDEIVTIIGVMPATFNNQESQIWLNPKRIVPDFAAGSQADISTARRISYLNVIGRLRPGVTIEQAQTDLDQISASIRQKYPDAGAHTRARIIPLYKHVVGKIEMTLFVLLGAVALVLLIACTNVVNLMMVRSIGQQKEIAIRTALGAGRRRIASQVLTEGMLLSSLGGITGCLLAIWGVGLLKTFSISSVPRLSEISVDGRVLLFTLITSLLTGLLFGLIPAMTASKIDINQILKDGARGSTSGPRHNHLRAAFVVAEVTLAIVVLIGAGLLVKSFVRLQTVRPGFDTSNLTTMLVWMSEKKYLDPTISRTFIKGISHKLGTIPGVQSVAIANDLPIRGTDLTTIPHVDGPVLLEDENKLRMGTHVVSAGYFKAMGIPLARGREFDEHDDEQSSRVIVVNDTTAKTLWPQQDAIGKRLRPGDERTPWYQVVGVVGDVRHDGLDKESGMHAYMVNLQQPWPVLRISLRSGLDSTSLAASVRREVKSIDPNQPVSDVRTMDDWLRQSFGSRRLATILFGMFAAVALLLTTIGVYGVISYSVSHRTHEIGVRIALGAQRRDVLTIITSHGLRLVLIGTGLGLALASALTRLMRSLLFDVSAADPLTYFLISLTLIIVAMSACYIPARRAMRVDPMTALREQ